MRNDPSKTVWKNRLEIFFEKCKGLTTVLVDWWFSEVRDWRKWMDRDRERIFLMRSKQGGAGIQRVG